MSKEWWAEFARSASDVELSPREEGDDTLVSSVLAQSAVVRSLPLDWADTPLGTIEWAPSDGDPAPGPAALTDYAGSFDPDRTAQVRPLAEVAAAPELHGFVEVYADATAPTGPSGQASEQGLAGQEPAGPLSGLVYARKDMFFRAGRLTECGSPLLEGHSSTVTASALQRVDRAGAKEVGRLHMAELALSPTGRNNWLGPGRNPWDRAHVSGGSSSGSGIAAATRAVHFTLGSDTGGSVRIPAAACGVTGFKPTHGVLPLDASMPLSPTLDCLGILAPAARTVSAVFEVLTAASSGPPSSEGVASRSTDAPSRPGTQGRGLGPGPTPTILVPDLTDVDELLVEDSARAALDAVAGAFAASGFEVRRTTAPDLGTLGTVASLITASEAASIWGDHLSDVPDDFYLEIRRRIERGTLVPAPVYARALRLRRGATRSFVDAHLPPSSLLLLPTTPGEAPTVASSLDGTPAELEQRFGRFSYWTRAINYLGLPAVSIPAGLGPSGLPIGVQLVGRPFADRLLLTTAVQLQEVTSWHTLAPEPARS